MSFILFLIEACWHSMSKAGTLYQKWWKNHGDFFFFLNQPINFPYNIFQEAILGYRLWQPQLPAPPPRDLICVQSCCFQCSFLFSHTHPACKATSSDPVISTRKSRHCTNPTLLQSILYHHLNTASSCCFILLCYPKCIILGKCVNPSAERQHFLNFSCSHFIKLLKISIWKWVFIHLNMLFSFYFVLPELV